MRHSTSFPDGELHAMRILYLILFVLLLEMRSYCTILVPDDYPSLQEAVEHSAAVDEIVISADQAELLESYGDLLNYRGMGGIPIVDKDLVIRSRTDGHQATLSSLYIPVFLNLSYPFPVFPGLYSEKHSIFYIQNSNVKFKDLYLDYSGGNIFSGGSNWITSCPITIGSSNVQFENCVIKTGIKTDSNLTLIDTEIQAAFKYDYHHALIALDYPLLYLDSCNNAKTTLIRSNIHSLIYEQEVVRISNCVNTDFILKQSNVYAYHSSRIAASNGIKVIDSDSLRINLDQSTIQAGSGVRIEGPNYYYSLPPYFQSGIFYDGVIGGNGISLINSSVTLVGGEICAGAGSPGSQLTNWFTDLCGDGGNAIELNNSNLQLYKAELIPGLGTDGFIGSVDGIEYPAGADGAEILKVKNSSVIIFSSAACWRLYN